VNDWTAGSSPAMTEEKPEVMGLDEIKLMSFRRLAFRAATPHPNPLPQREGAGCGGFDAERVGWR